MANLKCATCSLIYQVVHASIALSISLPNLQIFNSSVYRINKMNFLKHFYLRGYQLQQILFTVKLLKTNN